MFLNSSLYEMLRTHNIECMKNDFMRALNADHELNMLIAMQEIDAAEQQDLLDDCMVLYEDWRGISAAC